MMDLRRYPLDEQNCTLEIESCKYRRLSLSRSDVDPNGSHRLQKLRLAVGQLRRTARETLRQADEVSEDTHRDENITNASPADNIHFN